MDAVESRPRARPVLWWAAAGASALVTSIAGFVSIYWLDPSVGYAKPLVYFDSYLVNLGSWVEHIPGWASPNGHRLPEPLLVVGPAYVLLGGIALALSAALHHFRDAAGRSFVERGADRLAVSPRLALGLRALAVIGFVNLAMIVSSILVGLSALHLGPVPHYPSYMTNGMEAP